MDGRDRIELPADPPPDLVIEIDITHRDIDRQAIYAAMGVPEIWRFDGQNLQALLLRDGQHRPADRSAAFPFLKVADVQRFVAMAASADEHSAMRAFREWVRASTRPHPDARLSTHRVALRMS